MPSQRIARVEKLLRTEISTLLQRKIKDPRVSMVTLTEVDVSPDLKNARVLFSVLGDPSEHPRALAGLQSAAGFMRVELMKTLGLRPMPVLEFEFDHSFQQTARILDLIDSIRHEHEDTDGHATPDDRGDSQE